MRRPGIIFAAGMLLSALARPVWADTFWADTLALDDPQANVAGAVFVCLDEARDPEKVLTLLENAGWTKDGADDFWELSRNDVWVVATTEPGGFFACDVMNGVLSQSQAFTLVSEIVFDTRWTDWGMTHTEDNCPVFAAPNGPEIIITSDGNDPTCTPTNDSAIRISFAPGT